MNPDEMVELTDEEKLTQLKLNPMEYVKTLGGVTWLDYLTSHHPSDAHLLIRDGITKEQLRDVKTGSIDFKRRYYLLKEEASKSYTHDHKTVTNIELDRVATRVYQLSLNIIKVLQDEVDELKEQIAVLNRKSGIYDVVDVIPPVEEVE